MPNFEQFPPSPPGPEKEPPLFSESKEQEAQGVMTRLGNNARRWKDVYLASIIMGQFASSAIELAKAVDAGQGRAPEAAGRDEEREPSLEVDVRFDELRALDPEASPERIRLILDTLPQGFVEGEVASIGFTDRKFEFDESYGAELHEESEGAATAAGGTRAERAVITFWKGMKDSRSDGIWNATLLHEVAHANDWDNDHQMTAFERAELKAKVAIRVQADDRFRSDYVEAISNPDKLKELEIKAKEYWAEIVEEYLKGGTLPAPDEALVKGFIASQDPEFDRDAALKARRQAVGDMMIEENVAIFYDSLPPEERDAVEARVDARSKLEIDPPDPTLQRQGRKALAELMARHGATKEGQMFMIMLAHYEERRQGVYESKLEIDDDEGQQGALIDLAEAYQEMERAAEAYPGADMARKEFEETLDGYGIWAGGVKKRMTLERGELAEIAPSRDRFWIPYNLSWRGSQEDDTIDEYLERKVFSMPE